MSSEVQVDQDDDSLRRVTRVLVLGSAIIWSFFVFRFCFDYALYRQGYPSFLNKFWLAMGWNLILAWVPLIMIGLRHLSNNRILKSFFSLGAFVFLPNSFYMVTDLRHIAWLREYYSFMIWIDEILMFALAGMGVAIGLLAMRLLVPATQRANQLYVFGSALLFGFGIFLGRNVRLNSWEVLTDPGGVVAKSTESLLNPLAIGYTIVYGVLITLLYIMTIYLSGANQESNN